MRLYMYTIYCYPAGRRGRYVVRRFDCTNRTPEPIPDPEPWWVGGDLDGARASLPEEVIVRFPRDPWDAPAIVETWA